MKFALPFAALLVMTGAMPAFAADEAPAGKGPLYHVVAIKFKPGATPGQIKNVQDAFAELKTKIPLIQSLHWGTNVSKEKRNKGFTHCFVLTFASEKDRDAYLKDPAHKAFGQVLGPVAEDIFVIDFASEE